MDNMISKKVIVILIITFFLGSSSIPYIGGSKIQIPNPNTIKQDYSIQSTDHSNSLKIVSHLATQEEIDKQKLVQGVFDPTKNYNQEYDGYASGLVPPTEEEWNSMVGQLAIVDTVILPSGLRSSVDLSIEPYFPRVGNQGMQGSCTAWGTAYYANGYTQAKTRGWDQAYTGRTDQLLSPAFVYNKCKVKGMGTGPKLVGSSIPHWVLVDR